MVPARHVLYDLVDMLHRAARTATLLALLTLGACRSSEPGGDKGAAATRTEVVSEPKTGTTPGTDQDAPPASGALSEVHGDKWADADDPQTTGGMVKFKEAWVYVDGRPVGLLREAELPPLPEVWVDQVELLDFKAGDPPPHERTYQVLRWRLSDYFEAVGIDLKKVKAVLLHGGKGTALIPGKDFRRTKDKLLFDLTGNNNLKLRVFLPDSLDLNTSFDRYAAVSVIVDKPMPSTDDENDVVIVAPGVTKAKIVRTSAPRARARQTVWSSAARLCSERSTGARMVRIGRAEQGWIQTFPGTFARIARAVLPKSSSRRFLCGPSTTSPASSSFARSITTCAGCPGMTRSKSSSGRPAWSCSVKTPLKCSESVFHASVSASALIDASCTGLTSGHSGGGTGTA